jgi:hypothetical protein
LRIKGLHGDFWPDERDELLLRAALLDGQDVERAWRQVRPGLDLDSLTTESTRLLPLAWRNLTRLGIDDPLMPRLKGLYRSAWVRNHVLFQELSNVLEAFGTASIDSILLKGAALVDRYYKDVGVRPMVDIDLLVRPSDSHPAMALLEGRGWVHPPLRSDALEWTSRTLLINKQGLPLDLHWHLIKDFVEPGGDSAHLVDSFWAGATPVEFETLSTKVLGPADQLLHVCVHGARWGSGATLRWVADSITILLSENGVLDWDRLVEQTARVRRSLQMADALAYVCRTFDAPIPGAVLTRLRKVPTNRRDTIAHRLGVWKSPPLLGGLPQRISQYAELSATWSPGQAAVRFPRFMQHVWNLEGLWQVPSFALRKGLGSTKRWMRNRAQAGVHRSSSQ